MAKAIQQFTVRMNGEVALRPPSMSSGSRTPTLAGSAFHSNVNGGDRGDSLRKKMLSIGTFPKLLKLPPIKKYSF
jgi:hypothetical protein